MHRISIAILAIVAAFVLTACAAHAQSPPTAAIARYMQALKQSTDPADRAILKEIEAGPANLEREKASAVADRISLALGSVASPPAADNAEPIYDDWHKKLCGNGDWAAIDRYADPLYIDYAYTPTQLSRVQAFIDANKDLFGEMHRATERSVAYVPSRPDGFDFGITYPQMREAALELVTESFLLAHRKQYEQAIDIQSRGLHMARQLDYRPNLISNAVGMEVEAIALSGYRNIMFIAGPNAALDTRIERTIRTRVRDVSLQRALAGELPLKLAHFDMLRKSPAVIGEMVDDDSADSDTGQARLTPAEIVFVADMADASEARYIAYIRHLVAAADEPQWRRAAIFNRSVSIASSKSAQVRRFDFYQRITNVFDVVVQQCAVKDAEMRATERETEAMAELLTIKARSGRFPDVLPGGFIDPFNGKQLGYRREGRYGFVVYSVGPSGDFDGGKLGVTPKTWQAFVRYPAPKPVPVPEELVR